MIMNKRRITQLIIEGAEYMNQFVMEYGPYVTDGNVDTVESVSRVMKEYIEIAMSDTIIGQIDDNERSEFITCLSVLKDDAERNLEMVNRFRNQLWIEKHMMGC